MLSNLINKTQFTLNDQRAVNFVFLNPGLSHEFLARKENIMVIK